ncbi:hypothetical protein ACKLNO_03895 [Neisseriaceae bacterium B1]
MRQQFETWAKAQGFSVRMSPTRQEYTHQITRYLWLAWQQGAATS